MIRTRPHALRLAGLAAGLATFAVSPLALAQAVAAAPAGSPSSTPSAPAAPMAGRDTAEPRVDTSPRTTSPMAPTPAPDAAATRAPQAAPPAAAPATPAAARRPSGRAMDRVELEASQITGNRELPRVLYIVPWRAPEAGDLEGKPVNSLLYELTRPLDRDVFRRENHYFGALGAPPVRDTSQVVPPAGNP